MKINYVFRKGVPNAVYTDGEGRQWRVRAEVLIMKGGEIFINRTGKLNQYNRYYKIPGGSVEPDYGFEGTAFKESQEEARITIKNIRKVVMFKRKYAVIPQWQKEMLYPIGVHYVGTITAVMVADYGSKFNGFVKPEDDEPDMRINGRFYALKDVWDLLADEHKEAIIKSRE